MIPAIIGAGALGLSAVTGLIGQNQTNKTNIRLQREQNEWNAQQAAKANQWNLEQWQREAEYNSAKAQMQRLEEAGLNPNLMYGQGSPGTAGQVRSEVAASVSPAQVRSPLQTLSSTIIPAISMYQDLQNKNAQLTVQQKQAQLMDAEIQGKALENIGKQAKNEILYANASHLAMTSDYRFKTKKYQTEALQEKLRQQRLNNAILEKTSPDLIEKAHWVTRDVKQRALQGEFDVELSRELKPFGMTTRDDLWQRKFVPILEQYLTKILSGGKANTLYQLSK